MFAPGPMRYRGEWIARYFPAQSPKRLVSTTVAHRAGQTLNVGTWSIFLTPASVLIHLTGASQPGGFIDSFNLSSAPPTADRQGYPATSGHSTRRAGMGACI
jgi:hypothetical protein